ncbi:MAG: CDGSH iron-sulfur domain-containing protein [Candidatus Micrarchaeia archaeon]
MGECPEIEINATKDGPNIIKIDGKTKFALCRCGHSANKPYCDGTHKKINFQADEKEIKLK